MAVYTISPGEGKAEATLKVEGRVFSVEWEALRAFCLEALKMKEPIVLDLEKVTEHDFSLTVFVCLLRSTVLLLGKQITITGRREEFICQHSKGTQCSNIEASARSWCESLYDRSAGA